MPSLKLLELVIEIVFVPGARVEGLACSQHNDHLPVLVDLDPSWPLAGGNSREQRPCEVALSESAAAARHRLTPRPSAPCAAARAGPCDSPPARSGPAVSGTAHAACAPVHRRAAAAALARPFPNSPDRAQRRRS